MLLLLVVIRFLFTHPSTPPAQSSPTPTISLERREENQSKVISVLSFDPLAESQDIPINTIPHIIFSRDIQKDIASISITPTVSFTFRVSGPFLLIEFSELLQKNTTYTIEFNYPGLQDAHRWSFTTAGSDPVGTAPGEEFTRNLEDELRRAHPDFFLANNIPYTEDLFSIEELEFVTEPNDHFRFRVTLRGNETVARAALMEWLQSIGLTDAQIQGLDIEYRSE